MKIKESIKRELIEYDPIVTLKNKYKQKKLKKKIINGIKRNLNRINFYNTSKIF